VITTTSSYGVKDIPEGLNVINNPYKRRLTEDEVMGLIEEYQPVGMVAGVEPFTRKVLEKAENLKIISRCGVGTDSVSASSSTADSNANQTTCDVLDYLSNFQREEIIVGQLGAYIMDEGETEPYDNFEEVYDQYGKYPGLYGFERWLWWTPDHDTYVTNATNAWDNGSLVTAGFQSNSPPKDGTTIEDLDKTNPNRDTEACDIFWDTWVDDFAGYLQDLEDEGVTVLFRPLHEPENRGWIKYSSKTCYRNVWQQLFNELCVTRGLHNLLWVFCLERDMNTGWYPGDDYVDIVGVDLYKSAPYGSDDFEDLEWMRDTYPNKVLAVPECGAKAGTATCDAMDFFNALNTYCPQAAYMMWWHDATHSDINGWAVYLTDNASQYINHTDVYTQDEIDFNNPPPTPTPDLIHSYMLENNANDSEGSQNGTVYGATFSSSDKKEGSYSASFDGTNDYIKVDDFSFPVGGQPFSIAAWVKPTESVSQWKSIMHVGDKTANKFFDFRASNGKFGVCYYAGL
jgi:mannan endo-1,4-beta-mannosidase